MRDLMIKNILVYLYYNDSIPSYRQLRYKAIFEYISTRWQLDIKSIDFKNIDYSNWNDSELLYIYTQVCISFHKQM